MNHIFILFSMLLLYHMNRNLCYTALILRSRHSGESNREVWLLSAEAGLLRATLFGGPKSKLRAYVSPFNSGQAWIYQDPSKDSRKLSDFDVRSWRPGLRELYERTMAADAVAETILASHGGGGHWERSLSIAESVLDALAEADAETCSRITLCFFWLWADFLGLMPEFDHCTLCGKTVPADAALIYSPLEGSMICSECSAENQHGIETSPGCRRWLETIRLLSPAQLARYTLDKKSFREAKALTTGILAEALGKRLVSWDW